MVPWRAGMRFALLPGPVSMVQSTNKADILASDMDCSKVFRFGKG